MGDLARPRPAFRANPIDPTSAPCYTRPASTQIPMGLRQDSTAAEPAQAVAPVATAAGVRRAAPYAARSRDYYRSLSASSVGIELAVSVLIGLFFGRWLDGRIGTAPWMMILFLCLGFAAGLRSVYRFVRQADRDAELAEAEARAEQGASQP